MDPKEIEDLHPLTLEVLYNLPAVFDLTQIKQVDSTIKAYLKSLSPKPT